MHEFLKKNSTFVNVSIQRAVLEYQVGLYNNSFLKKDYQVFMDY